MRNIQNPSDALFVGRNILFDADGNRINLSEEIIEDRPLDANNNN